jgi:hypothetical protein
MWTVIKMSGTLYAMKSVESFDELHYDESEIERAQEFVNTGVPVIFCEDLDELNTLFPNGAEVEIVTSDDDEDKDEDS